MINLIKKSILFGMGSVSYTKEYIEKYVNELSKEGINPQEGRKMVEDLLKSAEESKKKDTLEIKKLFREIVDELGLATKEDIKNLKKTLTQKV